MAGVGRPIRILHVEDDPDDVLLLEAAFREVQASITLVVVTDGKAAADFLCQRGEFSDAAGPDLILLDLHLPKLDGHVLLAEIKGSVRLRCIPVIVLTTSAAASDVRHAYDNHANAYVQKPVGYDALVELVRAIAGFWLEAAFLTTRGNPRGNQPNRGAPIRVGLPRL